MNSSGEIYKFPWQLFDVLLSGYSVLDIPKLELKSMEEATTFLQAYGFDTNSSDDLAMLWNFFDEAIAFLEKSLRDPEYLKVPEHLKNRDAIKDIRRLLLMCSQPVTHHDQKWSCAILRVMHVLIHLAFDPKLQYLEQVRTQVLGRLDKFLFVDNKDGATYLGAKDGSEKIKLLYFKKKDKKDREREIIKLLHKAESVAEDIYDRIGFRLVTETTYDSMRAIKLLLEKNIISLPNLRPGRSRNRLVDQKRFQFEIQRIENLLSKSGHKMKEADIDKLFKRLERRIGYRGSSKTLLNPYTSETFRSIQFTCREMVKVNNPTFQLYAKLKDPIQSLHGGNQILSEVFPTLPAKHLFLFFPYEIQILDVKAYADSIFGKSSHEEYRRKQLEFARQRVFGKHLENK